MGGSEVERKIAIEVEHKIARAHAKLLKAQARIARLQARLAHSPRVGRVVHRPGWVRLLRLMLWGGFWWTGIPWSKLLPDKHEVSTGPVIAPARPTRFWTFGRRARGAGG